MNRYLYCDEHRADPPSTLLGIAARRQNCWRCDLRFCYWQAIHPRGADPVLSTIAPNGYADFQLVNFPAPLVKYVVKWSSKNAFYEDYDSGSGLERLEELKRLWNLIQYWQKLREEAYTWSHKNLNLLR